MKTIRELTDIELNEVAGGIGVIAIGTITGGAHNQAVNGTDATALAVAGGGIGNANVAAGNDGAWIRNIL
jgi:hypothetical protein